MNLIGRQAQVERLRGVMKFERCDGRRLSILGIEGPGGVGKSSLIEMAEQGLDYKILRALKVHLDSTEVVATLLDFVDGLIQGVKSDARRSYSRGDISLKKTEQAVAAARKILLDAQNEVAKNGDPVAIAQIYHRAMAFGKSVNKISPKTKDWADFEAMESKVSTEDVRDVISVFQDEVPNLFNNLGIFSDGKNLRNSIRANAAKVFAQALVDDLEVVLAGYNVKDAGKPLPSKIAGCDRLLLIVDDFESVSEICGEFLVKYFLPALKGVRFQSIVIIAGRDDLTVTHPSWNQHLQAHLLDPAIDVGPLSRSEIDVIAKREGVDSEVLWRDTDGYPYFIQLWVEADRRGGENAVSLKKFYDRTTRWMNQQQKEWLSICLLLDEVNIGSISKLVESEQCASDIFSWFEMEASIRDTKSKFFAVRTYIRRRLLDYLRLRDPLVVSAQEDRARELGVLKSIL
ncbi:MAG: hypothetical protein WAK59_05395 [Aquabacterium sp.]